MEYRYKTQNVCTPDITFDLNGDVVTNIRFSGGCPGNLKALSKVLDGWTVDKIESTMLGNTCGRRPTSCMDQLARGVRKAYEESKRA